MRNFHGFKKRKSYFEGWYLRHQTKGKVIAVIPAYHIDAKGKAQASIQVITNNNSYCVRFPAKKLWVSPDHFWVRIGKNVFSKRGIYLDIKTEKLTLKGNIRYGQFLSPRTHIMGPFRFIPLMQCKHEVVSLHHELIGSLQLNGEKIDFSRGKGYIEKDWGNSFPKEYCWTQSNWGGKNPGCVMAAAADIPLLGSSFPGCIAMVHLHRKEYRLATYKGAYIQKNGEKELVIKQWPYSLQISLQKDNPHPLRAPRGGDMSRMIMESPLCKVKYKFLKGRKVLMECRSQDAAFEKILA